MNGMLALRVDKWVRVGSGLGLLLLLVAQEKVCPWLLASPARAEPKVTDTTPPSDGHKPAQKRTSKRLPYIVPDAPAPRWPGTWGQITLRQSVGARDGVVGCGRRELAGDDAPTLPAGGDRCAWYVFLRLDPTGELAPRIVFTPAAHPGTRTSISPTGPPAV